MRRNVIVFVVFALATAGVVVATVRAREDDGPVAKGPNIVVVMTDDQTLESMRVLPRVQKLLRDAGTSFTNYAVSFPNCCPSRATFLTGQHAHNNGVRDNVPPDGGFAKLRGDETLPVWLQRGGYTTASVGKYLNTWGDGGDIDAPKGWDRWYSLIDPSTYKYFDYDVSVDGERTHFGHGVEDYSTDVLAREAVRYIGAHARDHVKQPFFLSFTPLAPHVAAIEKHEGKVQSFSFPTPAPRYDGSLPDARPPRTASYDQQDISTLPRDARRPIINASDERYIARYYQAELETLRAVDDAVQGIVDELERTGQLDDTVILYTSDNGLFHGEHRIRNGKYYLYEPAVHLPLFIRGGSFASGALEAQPASNVDLAPTILDLAGLPRPDLELDGRSLVPSTAPPPAGGDRGVLLENRRGGGEYEQWGIRTERWKFITNADGESELYDLVADPDEAHNLAGTAAHAADEADLRRRALALHRCAGATCEGSDASRGGGTDGTGVRTTTTTTG